MEFVVHPNLPPLKNLYPCLATINIFPPGSDKPSRRLSSSGGGDDDHALRRVISGGRRRSSFGVGQVGDNRRMSTETEPSGTWYWRVQAGVSEVSDTQFLLSNVC